MDDDLHRKIQAAVAHYWQVRALQHRKQEEAGKVGHEGIIGKFETPADDLSIERFIKILNAHVASFE